MASSDLKSYMSLQLVFFQNILEQEKRGSWYQLKKQQHKYSMSHHTSSLNFLRKVLLFLALEGGKKCLECDIVKHFFTNKTVHWPTFLPSIMTFISLFQLF